MSTSFKAIYRDYSQTQYRDILYRPIDALAIITLFKGKIMKNAQENQIQKISEISTSGISESLKLELIQTILNSSPSSPSSPELTVKPVKARKTVQTVKRDGRPLMKYITRELLTSCAGVTEKEVVNTLSNLYPEKEVGTIEKTTKRRLKGEGMNLNGKEIVHDDKEGIRFYFLQEKEANY